MKLLHTYPALAFIGDVPRLKADQIEVCGIPLHVYREANVYLDSHFLVTRYNLLAGKHTYCVEIRAGLLAVLTTAVSDEALVSRLTTVAEWGPRAGLRPIDGLEDWKAGQLAIADDTEGYTAKAKASIAERNAARDAEKAKQTERVTREALERRATRIERNTAAFKSGESIDFAGFEELCGIHGISMPIRTLGACRKNVSEVSKNSISVAKGSKPDGIWQAIRALKAALEPVAVEVIQ